MVLTLATKTSPVAPSTALAVRLAIAANLVGDQRFEIPAACPAVVSSSAISMSQLVPMIIIRSLLLCCLVEQYQS